MRPKMGPAKRNFTKSSKGTGKEKTNENNSSNDAPSASKTKLPQFTLVIYDDKTRGVVETQSIKNCKDKAVGRKCQALLPIDTNWEDSDDEKTRSKLYSATIIAFGKSINFLYELPLYTSGSLTEPESEIDVLAPRKARQPDSVKANALRDFDRRMLERITEANNNQGGTNVTVQCKSSDKTEVIHSDKAKLQLRKLSQIDIAPTQAPSSHSNLKLSKISHMDIAPTSPVDDNISYECDTLLPCPVQKILSTATPDQLQFVRDLTAEKLALLGQVVAAINLHQDEIPMEAEDGEDGAEETTSKKNAPFSAYPCSKQDGEKFELIAGRPVYVSKEFYLSIPHVIKDPTKPASSNHVSDRTMVNLLVDELVPKEFQGNSATTLPTQIVNIIMAFVNARLDSPFRLKIAQVRRYITSRIANSKRDRDGERKRRLEKEERGEEIKKRKQKANNPLPLPNSTNIILKAFNVTGPNGEVETIYVNATNE